jgi:methionine synthase II (cobalamin-independent)
MPCWKRHERGETVVLTVPSAEARLRQVESPAASEAAFMARLTEHPFKVSFRAASLFAHPFGVSPNAYATPAEFIDPAIAIERGLIADAIEAGCRYVQLDFPLYRYLVDRDWSARFEAAGHTVSELLEKALVADKAISEGIPDGITTGLRLCRATTDRAGSPPGLSSRSQSGCSTSFPTTSSSSTWTTSIATAATSPSASLPRGGSSPWA